MLENGSQSEAQVSFKNPLRRRFGSFIKGVASIGEGMASIGEGMIGIGGEIAYTFYISRKKRSKRNHHSQLPYRKTGTEAIGSDWKESGDNLRRAMDQLRDEAMEDPVLRERLLNLEKRNESE